MAIAKHLRVVSAANYITGAEFPSIQDLYTRRWQRKAQNIFRRQPPKP